MTNNASKNSRISHPPLATTVKANSASSPLLVNRPQPQSSPHVKLASQLRQRFTKGAAPLSSPGIEPLLPEDDLNAFFRSRAVTTHSLGTTNLVKVILGLASACILFVGLYNYQPKFRGFSHTQARNWFDVNLNDYVPEMGPRNKKKSVVEIDAEKFDRQLKENRGRTTIKQSIALDPRAMLVRTGRWKDVAVQLKGRCTTWEATSDCAVKGYFYATKGLLNAIRPMTSVSQAKVASMKHSDRLLWHLSIAMAVGEAGSDRPRFTQALALAPASSSDLRRFIYDEMVLSSYLGKRPKDVSYFISRASKEKMAPFWEAAIAKWRVIENVGMAGFASSAVLDDFLKKERGSVRHDPRSIEILTTAFIRGNKSERFLSITTDAVAEALQSKIDAQLQKKILASHMRILWSLGKRGEANAVLIRYAGLTGRDALSRHYQAAAFLQNGGSDQASRSLVFLGALGPNPAWETLYLQGFAYIRSGSPARARPIIQQLSAPGASPNQRRWASLLRAEYLLSQRRFSEAQKVVEPMVSSPSFPVVAAEILRKSYEGQGRDRESMALRSKIDDGRSKTSYWSSPEMLGSPLGPLALIR